MTSAERQAKLRERRRALGIEQFTDWAPKARHSELRALFAFLVKNPGVVVESVGVRDPQTGRVRGVKL